MYHTLARILLIERQIESRKCVFQISDTCLSCALSLVFPRANQIYLSSRCRTSGTPTNSRSRDHCQINRYQSYYYCMRRWEEGEIADVCEHDTEVLYDDIGNGRAWDFKLNNSQKRQPLSQRARPNFPADMRSELIRFGESVPVATQTTLGIQLIISKLSSYIAKPCDGRSSVNNFEEKRRVFSQGIRHVRRF